MSSTNKTTNYELSQFIGTDKPTYLGDYNGDMLKIDTQMKANADNIASVGSTATTASTNASTALTNAQTAQTTAETAQTTANNAQTSATSALSKATQVEADMSKFNFTDFDTYTASQISTTRGTLHQNSSVQVATNSDGSIGKIYGNIIVNNTQISSSDPNEFSVIIPNTKLRPASTITITGCSLRGIYTSNGFNDFVINSYTVAPNGTVTILLASNQITTTVRCSLIGCLLFLQDFGDTPVPEN